MQISITVATGYCSSPIAPVQVLSTWCSPSGTGCSSVGLRGSQAPPANLLQHGVLFPPVHRSCQQPASAWALHGVRLLWTSPCSSVGSSPGCRWISAPPWTSMGCRGTACLTVVFSTGCRGISTPVPGVPPLPPSALTLLSAELFLSHIVIPLFWMLLHSKFFSLLKHVITAVLPPLLMGLALPSGRWILELAGTVGHGESS